MTVIRAEGPEIWAKRCRRFHITRPTITSLDDYKDHRGKLPSDRNFQPGFPPKNIAVVTPAALAAPALLTSERSLLLIYKYSVDYRLTQR